MVRPAVGNPAGTVCGPATLALTDRVSVEMLGMENSLALVATHSPLNKGRFAGIRFWNTKPEMLRTTPDSPSHVQPSALHAAWLAADITLTTGFGLATTLRVNVPSGRCDGVMLTGSADRPVCVGSYEPRRMTNEYVPSSSPDLTFGASSVDVGLSTVKLSVDPAIAVFGGVTSTYGAVRCTSGAPGGSSPPGSETLNVPEGVVYVSDSTHSTCASVVQEGQEFCRAFAGDECCVERHDTRSKETAQIFVGLVMARH